MPVTKRQGSLRGRLVHPLTSRSRQCSLWAMARRVVSFVAEGRSLLLRHDRGMGTQLPRVHDTKAINAAPLVRALRMGGDAQSVAKIYGLTGRAGRALP